MIEPRRSTLLVLALVATLLPATATMARDDAAATAERKTVDRNAIRINNIRKKMNDRLTQEDREAAARNLKALKAKVEAARQAAVLKPAAKATSTKSLAGAALTSQAVQVPPTMAPPGPGDMPDYFTTANWAFSPPLRKFVDSLPGLGPTGANNLGNYIPVAVPDTTTYPGSDYYEISLKEYTQRLHSDLPAPGTRLRGYVQTNSGTDAQTGLNTVAPAPIKYLGPIIVAQKDRPVRIKFTNELPSGRDGDLFIPVDESVMGAGKGPLFPDGSACDPTPPLLQDCAKYPQNRAAIHLHGGRTPWISDGTPHQWVVPAADELDPLQPYKKGVSYENVPDMPEPGPGSMTYYYSNQQSARLMFYHDHAWGITRLNVVVGEAAGYLITDQVEQDLVSQGVLPADQIPLVIQDRTFVDPDTVRTMDPTWNWGTGTPDQNGIRPPVKGDFWLPHVYMPAQNPFDVSGANPYGRWVYGPWFFPPTNNIMYGPVPNPYHDPACSSTDPAVFANCTTPGQPPVIPGTPVPSVGMETFFDTAMVNGTAFPHLDLLPKAYRFRILNAANDRFMNLSLYEADATQVAADGRLNTEVKIVPAASGNWDGAAWPLWPADGREPGVPDPATQGPAFIQVGTESGFLPRPVVVPAQPIGYVTDPTVFNFGNVKDHALLLGPAERADVVVDFSAWAGKTLILYNDAPAAFPARDIRVDYYAGQGDLSDTGGYWGVQTGFGPNTRTIMQINVASSAPAAPFDLAALTAAMLPAPTATPPHRGAFESSQDPLLVGQSTYDGVYTDAAGTGTLSFPPNWPAWGYSRISDHNLTFKTVGGTLQTFPMEPKGIHDEMGAAFDKEYGRMSGNLGISIPFAQVGLNNFTLYAFVDPATEILNDTITPLSPVLGDGMQIWKISQNGVDTHPIHFHVFDVQLINRVGWDGLIRPPDANELGWKETVRISPLEDTIVAMRMWAPKLPFGVPTSLRPLNPAIPVGSPFGFTNIDPITQQVKVPVDLNRVEDFGWEYVWHCHILSHEEMDMMRPIILNVEVVLPTAPTLAVAEGAGGVQLTWNDPTPVNYVSQEGFGLPTAEIGFKVERGEGPSGPFTVIANVPANRTSYLDTTAAAGTFYRYRVTIYNAAGSASSLVKGRDLGGAATPATSVALAASPATTPYARTLPTVGNPADGSVAFTATPTGGSGLFEYRFSLSSDGGTSFAPVQAFTASDTWVMPATQPAGAYVVQVEVRTSAGEAAPFPAATLAYEVQSNPGTVGLTASVPSPRLYGSALSPTIFTAAPTGGAATKEYRFSLDSGAGYAVVQNWSATATWQLPPSTLPASMTVKVESRTDLSPTGIATATMPYVVQYPPASGLLIQASKSSPAIKTIIPTPIVFTALATGSAGYSYRFSLQTNGGAMVMVRDWSATSTWTMAADTAPGNYVVQAEVSTSGGAVVDKTALKLMNVVTKKATGVSLAATPATRANPGTVVTFTAAGANSAGYHYRFRLSQNGGAESVAKDWSPSNTYVLPGTAADGSYTVTADVWADSSTTATAEASSSPVTVQVRLAVPTSLALSANRTSPADVNITPLPTVFTATPAGSSGYQYRWWLKTGAGDFVLQQDYGTSATWTLPANTPIGAYQVKVDVRTSAIVDLDLTQTMDFVLKAPAPASGVTIAYNLSTPQPQGTPVTFTLTASGSTGYVYRFWLSADAGAHYTKVQDWSAASSWVMPGSTVAGTYRVLGEVKTTSGVYRDVYALTNFTIRQASATGVTLTPADHMESPHAMVSGQPVVFTAQGEGLAGTTFYYRFLLNDGTGYVEKQAWSASNTWSMPDTTPVGSYTVMVEVSSLLGASRDAFKTLSYVVRPTKATGVLLSADPAMPSPHKMTAGQPVRFTASGQGAGSATYYYRFLTSTDGGAYVQRQAWSTTNTWDMPDTWPPATYRVFVEVKTYLPGSREAYKYVTYQVTP